MPLQRTEEEPTGLPDFAAIELADVIDAPALQEMMSDYHAITGIGIGILDLKGKVLVGTGWQDVCVKFHRAHPVSCAFCHESDISLASGVRPGTFKAYRCKNNMWDIATPIMLGERHVGNIFLGQFFYDDEEPDYDLFRAQAKRFGYDQVAYLAALKRVPRYSRQTIDQAMNFYSKLAGMISKANYNNVILTDTLARSRRYEQELLAKNAELECFSYTVSHDLKSPLITIKGFAGALAKDLAAGNHERMASDIRRISDAADKMNDLLNDLLQLCRIGRVINSTEQVPMGELVREVLAQLAGPLQARGVEVVVQPDLPSMRCDRLRLAEVVQNLVENAIKYMGGEAAPRIEISMRRDEGREVFCVRDNGMGIEEQYHENIFGLFNKLNGNSEGTGIGLALVKRIVEGHGGSCWVESEGEGKGSTFCFALGQAESLGDEAVLRR